MTCEFKVEGGDALLPELSQEDGMNLSSPSVSVPSGLRPVRGSLVVEALLDDSVVRWTCQSREIARLTALNFLNRRAFVFFDKFVTAQDVEGHLRLWLNLCRLDGQIATRCSTIWHTLPLVLTDK